MVGLVADDDGPEGVYLLHDVRVVAVGPGRDGGMLPHVRRVNDVEHALLAAADDPAWRAGDEHRPTRSEIEIEAVQKPEVARREEVLDDERRPFELELDEAVTVVLAT